MYLFGSVIASTFLIFILSLIFGLTDTVIFTSYVFWFLSFLYILNTKRKIVINIKNKMIYIFAFLVFIIFYLALKNAIFYRYENYYVMSADNWQDTALHLSIIESIKEGNFPPQAPYFSKSKLRYHYFTDLHSAILTYPLHKFTPRILIVDNALFASVFFMSIYGLAMLLTNNIRTSIISSFLATFSGSMLYANFLKDYLAGLGTVKELILTGNYVLEYGKLFQMAPMTNYFLQNRPMMVGMTSISVSLYLLFVYLSDPKERKFLYLTIGIASLCLNFQIICSLIIFACVAFAIYKVNPKLMIAIVSPVIILILFFKSYLNLFIQNFSYGPWTNNGIYWIVKFIYANLGIPFFLFSILIALILLKRIVIDWKLRYLIYFLIATLLIPFLFTFTIDRADMLKFFYISYIPLSILASMVIDRITNHRLGLLVGTILIAGSVLTGVIDLAGSSLNKNLGYTNADLKVGIWIRNNTPQKSIFVSSPTVHSPVSDIGGRLRVLSYTNWPYTHGYNSGEDNVFVRSDDIKKLFNNIDNSEITINLLDKYGIRYVYFGPQELADFPEAKNKLESSRIFKLIYDENGIKIYGSI